MNVRRIVVLAALAALLVPVMAWAAGPMNPGKWEVTVKMDMPGMAMPAHTMNVCVSKEQAEKPEPPKGRRDNDCQISDYKLDGNTVTYKMECKNQGMTGDGKFTYSGDTYTGVVHMKMADHEMTQNFTAKRLGDCDGTEINAKK